MNSYTGRTLTKCRLFAIFKPSFGRVMKYNTQVKSATRSQLVLQYPPNTNRLSFGTRIYDNSLPMHDLTEFEKWKNDVIKSTLIIPKTVHSRNPVIRQNNTWIHKVCLEAPTFHKTFGASLVIDTYRHTTTSEFQTPEHMRLVYTVATVVELVSSSGVAADDVFDEAVSRGGRPCLHITHPKSYAVDTLLLITMGLEIIRSQVPLDHPCRKQMYEETEKFIRKFFFFHAFDAVLSICSKNVGNLVNYTNSNDQQPPYTSIIPFERLNIEVYNDVTYLRFGRYLLFCFNMGRYSACYMKIDNCAIQRLIVTFMKILSVLDDLLEFISSKNDICFEDIKNGAITNLLCSLLDPTSNKNIPCLSDRQHVLQALRNHYGTKKIEDAKVVWKLFYQFGAHEMSKEYLRLNVEELQNLYDSGACGLNFPVSVLNEILIRTVLNDDDTRVEDKALTLRELQGTNVTFSKNLRTLIDSVDLSKADEIAKKI